MEIDHGRLQGHKGIDGREQALADRDAGEGMSHFLCDRFKLLPRDSCLCTRPSHPYCDGAEQHVMLGSLELHGVLVLIKLKAEHILLQDPNCVSFLRLVVGERVILGFLVRR